MPTETKARPEDLRISDETARLILERAIQLDAQRPGDTTLAELQRVAQELNVSSGALMEAIRELQTKAVAAPAPVSVPAPVPVPDKPPARAGSWWRTASIAIGSFLFAAVNVSDSYRDPEISLVFLGAASLALVSMHRRNRTPRAFQRDLLGLFAGVALGWVITGGRGAEEMVYMATFSWLLASTLGGWITRFRNRAPEAETAP